MSSRVAPHILILEARFYEDIADALVDGATSVLSDAGATWERVAVPGALEIPIALTMAVDAGLFEGEDDDDDEDNNVGFDGCIVLGCVIRGETYHFEIVSNGSAQVLTQLASDETIALGNGILTVENRDQALARTQGDKNKGADAAAACLSLIEVRKMFDALADVYDTAARNAS